MTGYVVTVILLLQSCLYVYNFVCVAISRRGLHNDV